MARDVTQPENSHQGRRLPCTLLLVLDLIGAFVFTLSGASAGIRHRLGLFGMLVLAFVAGNFAASAAMS